MTPSHSEGTVGNSKTFNPPLHTKEEVDRFLGLLSEEVFERLDHISTKYRQRATKVTVSVSRGKERVKRRGIEVSVAGQSDNSVTHPSNRESARGR